jgi:hypothetical protein
MTNLFAAADIKKGKAWTKTYGRKRRVEFVKFMDYVVKSVPGERDPDNGIKLHVVLENYCTHKGCEEWLADHKNDFMHLTPTNASWLNLGEVFFGKIQCKLLKNGNFKSKREMLQAINDFVKVHNINCISYRWRKRDMKGTQLSNIPTNLCDQSKVLRLKISVLITEILLILIEIILFVFYYTISLQTFGERFLLVCEIQHDGECS